MILSRSSTVYPGMKELFHKKLPAMDLDVVEEKGSVLYPAIEY